MGSEQQIVIVGTGYWPDLNMYMTSIRHQQDHPAYMIRRDGTLEHCCGYGQVLAIENAGPVVLHNGSWTPAYCNQDGKYQAIEGAQPVRVPYEYCSCKPYHGCQHYEYVGDKQLATLREVLKQWIADFGIRYPYDNQLGEICPRAQAGKSGIYFASSFDKKRADIHPQREIIDIIKAFATA